MFNKRIATYLAAFVVSPSLVGCLSLAGKEARGYSFTLNGKTINPYFQTLRSLGIDRDGGLVHLDDITLLLDEEGSYNLKGDMEKNGKLHLTFRGKTQLIGLRTGWSYRGDAKVHANPFAALKAEDMKHVRGVCLDEVPSKRVLELLTHVNPEKAFITVTDEAATGDNRALPAVPSRIKYLEVDESSSLGIRDYSHLRSLKSLVYLRLQALSRPEIGLELIKESTQLVYLDLSMQDLHNTQVLGNLKELRYLDLSYCDKLSDVSFVSELARLDRLLINHTQVSDLSPLQTLESIRYVDANNTKLLQIPKRTVRGLEKLKVMGTPLSAEMVAAFKEANPHCVVSWDWNQTFQAAVEGVDRIRVRSGGTCHRRPEAEQTLFEIKERERIKETIAQIVIDPSKSDFHCMCCGDPSFEFYKGDDLIATLGFHHGRSLRWADGEWPGDGLLAGDSAEFLCKLLDKHGIKGPLAERIEERKREEAAAKRWALYERLLPDEVKKRLEKAKTPEDQLKAFLEGEKKKERRVVVALKVIGCDFGSWNQLNCLDPIVIALLGNKVPSVGLGGEPQPAEMKDEEKINTSDIIDAIEKEQNDVMLLRGAARWFFGERQYPSIPGDQMTEILPAIARQGVSHPRQINRRRTLLALKKLNNASAIAILQEVMAGKIKVIPLKEEESLEPGGMVDFGSEDSEVEKACSDQAYSALILAQLGHSEELGRIRALLSAEKQAESREVLQKAINTLVKRKTPRFQQQRTKRSR